MAAIDNIKNHLIDRILASKNEQLLMAIEKIFASTQKEDTISLSSEQIELLMSSEEDIKTGNIVSESDLEDYDSK